MRSVGYGVYNNFGYGAQPEKGLFNPPQSLYTSDATLYTSLFATKEKPGKAWKHDLSGFGEEKSLRGPIIVMAIIIALYALTSLG